MASTRKIFSEVWTPQAPGLEIEKSPLPETLRILLGALIAEINLQGPPKGGFTAGPQNCDNCAGFMANGLAELLFGDGPRGGQGFQLESKEQSQYPYIGMAIILILSDCKEPCGIKLPMKIATTLHFVE